MRERVTLSIMRNTPSANSETEIETSGFEELRKAAREMSRTDEISLRDLLTALKARRSFLGVSTLSVAILALIACLVLPKRYTAITTLLPPQQNSSLSGALLSQM